MPLIPYLPQFIMPKNVIGNFRVICPCGFCRLNFFMVFSEVTEFDVLFDESEDAAGSESRCLLSVAFETESTLMKSLSEYLQTRRAEILRSWRDALAADEALTSGRQLTRVQLLDHVPQLLDSLEKSLLDLENDVDAQAQEHSNDDAYDVAAALPPGTRQTVFSKEVQAAREHGIHRWQQGYSVWEVTREFGHLHLCLADEFGCFSETRPDFGAIEMHRAHRKLALLINAGIEQSVEQFTRGREAEARTQVRNLEQVLAEFGETERARGHSLREASHDLRGSLAVVEGTASLLRQTEETPLRNDLTELMQRGVESLKRMMADLLDLARLEAGEEKLRMASFDVADVLRDLCVASQPLAQNSGLTLEAHGDALTVEGDAVKTQRIAQNLLLNALKYTQKGGVRVEWKKLNQDEWTLRVLDSGGGVDSHQIAPLVHKFKEATDVNREAQQAENDTTSTRSDANDDAPTSKNAQKTPGDFAASDASQTEQQTDPQGRLHPGEGIGLTIVKRLCDLLDARLEVESNANGSVFCVIFPMQYDGKTRLK